MISALFYDKGLELEGSEVDLRQFANDLDCPLPSRCISLVENLDKNNRGLRHAHSIKVLVASSLVDINVFDQEVIISGSKDKLAFLAQHILWLADNAGPNSSHIHIEYYPDHFFLSKTALPLVVSIQMPND